jgi:hypothetical protein
MDLAIVDPALAEELRRGGVEWCLIGAAALATHGYARTTDDIDLLTLDGRVLSADFWGSSPVRIRRGDFDDPLVGSVVWPAEPQHDVVVGKGHAAREALSTAPFNQRLGCRVATALALVLLKLEAGGAQDLYDVVALVERRRALDGAAWFAEVPAHLPRLSASGRDAWTRMQSLCR